MMNDNRMNFRILISDQKASLQQISIIGVHLWNRKVGHIDQFLCARHKEMIIKQTIIDCFFYFRNLTT